MGQVLLASRWGRGWHSLRPLTADTRPVVLVLLLVLEFKAVFENEDEEEDEDDPETVETVSGPSAS